MKSIGRWFGGGGSGSGSGIDPSIVTAKGDLIAATGSGVVDNVAVGTNGTVLTADSTAAAGVAYTLPYKLGLPLNIYGPVAVGSYTRSGPDWSSACAFSTDGFKAVPFWAPVTASATLALKVSVAGGANSIMRIGVYAHNETTGRPTGSPLWDSGDLAVSSTGNVVPGANYTFTAGTQYWIVLAVLAATIGVETPPHRLLRVRGPVGPAELDLVQQRRDEHLPGVRGPHLWGAPRPDRGLPRRCTGQQQRRLARILDHEGGLMKHTRYHPGGYRLTAPAQNRAEEWDSDGGYTAWDTAGEVTQQRPLTADEISRFAEDAAAQQTQANEKSISTKLQQDLTAMQAILDQTNADLNAGPAQELKDLARAVRRLIRKVERILDDTE